MFDKKCFSGDGKRDFLFAHPIDRPLRVLQMTDIQTVGLQWTRNATRDRQIRGAYFKNGVYGMEERAYAHIRALVKETAPDLILLTGDNIYGEFDDEGVMLAELIEVFEEIGLPWATTFGNHDPESRIGIDRICAAYEAAPHCLFRRGNVTGNANYSIGITTPDGVIFTLFLLDTGGCHPVGNPGAPEEGLTPDNPDFDKLEHRNRIAQDQMNWYKWAADGVRNAVFLHIAPHIFLTALSERYGFRPGKEVTLRGEDCGQYVEQMREADFTDPDGTFFEILKKNNCAAVFAGHQHKNNMILRDYQGITLGYGQKTGFCTFWSPGATGGTLHEITANGQFFSRHTTRG